MKTDVLTPMQVFNLPQRLVVPLFQRKYVWTQENQWELLWDDIQRVTELRMSGKSPTAQHFLGAAVLHVQSGRAGSLPEWTVIDGQQRLTTLQLIIDAAGAVMETCGLDRLARQMDALTANPEDFWDQPEDRFKVLPTNRDRVAFQEVMAAAPPVDYAALQDSNSLMARAHQFFAERIAEWVGDPTNDNSAPRAEQLARVLQQGLQLVVINLGTDEDTQEIFETLNARGTPLTAADLIKNFVFRQLALEGADVERAYHDHWLIFESPFWEKEISVGRNLIARSSLFLNQWLIAKVAEEVSPRATFSRFKYFVEHELTGSMTDLVITLRRQAALYQQWVERSMDPNADLGTIELFLYRTTEFEFVKPLLLWLTDVSAPYPSPTISAVIDAVESWVMRHAMLGLTTGDLGRVVADLIKIHRGMDSSLIADRIVASLARLNRASTFWPDDDQIRRDLAEIPAYRQFRRGRLRMLLEAAEDHLRGFAGSSPAKAGHRVPRGELQIEHLLPQQWRMTWPVDSLPSEIDRDAHVHRLGNLTLITGSLNASVSNGPWLGEDKKLSQLDRHDVILLNRWIRRNGSTGWDETLIDTRTQLLIDALLATWRVPAGHHGVVDDLIRTDVYIEIKHLVAAGLIEPGTELIARTGEWGDIRVVVLGDGRLQLGATTFDTLSGAAAHLRQGATNGWSFWRLEDGRRMTDVRAEFRRSSIGN